MDGCRKYQHVSGKISVFGVRGVYIGERKKRGGGINHFSHTPCSVTQSTSM